MRISKPISLACVLLAGLLPVATARASSPPDADRRPFLLGGIQLNEDDHERWAASLIQAGMNAVEVTAYAHQGGWHTADLWYAEEEPAVLAEIRAARRNGLQVVLILRVALDHNDPANRFLWHGLIYPETEPELEAWFRHYAAFVVKWARIAQAEGVEVLGIASEMNSLLATLPVEEMPGLATYYLDEAKQAELRELVGRHLHLFSDADRISMGAGDFSSLDDFLVQRNHAERRWARTYTFAAEGERVGEDAITAEGERIEKINQRRRLLQHHWQQLIGQVREVYHGRLTLAANFDNYHEVAFWKNLDFIGINAYFPLRASLETPLREASLKESWRQVFADIEAFRETHDLRQEVVFTELGYTRRKGVTVAPWSSAGFVPMWDDTGHSILMWSAQPIDPPERALAVRALRSAWREDGLPLAGVLYWKLSSRLELGRYEPFMLYLGADSEDPLYEAFTRFGDGIRPLDPLAEATNDLHARWVSAVARGDVEAVAQLGASSEHLVGPEGPLLHLAVRLGEGDVVRELLRQGADVEARDAAGYLALHWSCYQQDPSLVALLLPPQAASRRDDLGETPLAKCSRLDNVAVARELLRHPGAVVDARNEASQTALRLVADQGSAELVDLLLSDGAAVDEADADGVTPLHGAARRGDAGIVELLSTASKKEVKDSNGNRPVSYAAYFGKPEAFRLLWDGATAKARNADGQSMLHLAAHGGDPGIVETLLRQGLKVNLKDRSGRTPLHYAAMKTHRSIVRLLLERGAAVDRVDQKGRTAVHVAAEKDDTQLLRLLLKGAPALNLAGADGNTPLHHAAGWGRLENVRLLLAAGARQGVRNDKGETALEIAEASGRKRVAHLLRGPAALSASAAVGGR